MAVLCMSMYPIITTVSEFWTVAHPIHMQALAALLGTVSIRLSAGSLVDGEISGATRSVGRVVSSRYVAAVQDISSSDPQTRVFLKACVSLASSKKEQK